MPLDLALYLDLHEGRHDVGHFDNSIGRGVFIDPDQLALFHGCDNFKLISYKNYITIL